MNVEFFYDLFVSWTHYGFMRMALYAVLLIAPLYALLGTMVVDGRMAFFSDSLGHSAMTGIALGVLLGLETPLWAMLVFGVLYALLLSFVKSRGAASTDTTISVFSSSFMALGIVLLSKGGGFARYSAYLVGDLLSITKGELNAAAVILLLTILFWFFGYNSLMFSSINPSLSASRGVRTRLIETAFACLLAVVVMISIRWVGILIISALLVLPAASARNVARNIRSYHLLSLILALLCGAGGLLLSFALDTASGATIVLLLTVCYTVTLLLRQKMRFSAFFKKL